MDKLVSAFAILAVGLIACGGSGGSGAAPLNAASIPKGSGWSCHNDGESKVHSCYRGQDACKEAGKGKGECVDVPSVQCITYHEPSHEGWACFDDNAMCNKFGDFMKKKGATDVSSCVEQS